MIDALFNDPNYLAGKKTLDAIALREQAIASNIANLETPGCQRVDLASSFKAELDRACASGDAQEIAALKPGLAPDTIPSAIPASGIGQRPEIIPSDTVPAPGVGSVLSPGRTDGVSQAQPSGESFGSLFGRLVDEVNTIQPGPAK